MADLKTTAEERYVVVIDDDPEDRSGIANRLTATHNGEAVMYGTDHGEPEDNSFHRDYDWIKPALEQAYALGVADAAALLAENARLRAVAEAAREYRAMEAPGLDMCRDVARDDLDAALSALEAP